jgi:hypothetical protein
VITGAEPPNASKLALAGATETLSVPIVPELMIPPLNCAPASTVSVPIVPELLIVPIVPKLVRVVIVPELLIPAMTPVLEFLRVVMVPPLEIAEAEPEIVPELLIDWI